MPRPARPRRRRALVPPVALLALATVGCGGSSTPLTPAPRTPPDLHAFLRLPVATPTACPSTVSGTTSGRRSPWVGHVDVSVFLARSATAARTHRIRRQLEQLPAVRTVYYESKRQAYAEFQRLYTCSAQVKPGSVPASYRLVLTTVTQPERDALVRRIRTLDGVGSVSCDPSNPCVVDPAPTDAK